MFRGADQPGDGTNDGKNAGYCDYSQQGSFLPSFVPVPPGCCQESRSGDVSGTLARVIQVVGAAIVRDGRVLSARRAHPPALAGRWEFPGGKVEGAEDPADALTREIREELGCAIEVGPWLDLTVPINTDAELRLAWATVITGNPSPAEHDQVRWLSAHELESVTWLDADQPFLAQVRDGLLGSAQSSRNDAEPTPALP